jgi:hypothetical protein
MVHQNDRVRQAKVAFRLFTGGMTATRFGGDTRPYAPVHVPKATMLDRFLAQHREFEPYRDAMSSSTALTEYVLDARSWAAS